MSEVVSQALAGKVAIVTGGNSGIGRAVVHRFARTGASVAILARREREGLEVQDEVRKDGGAATFFTCDLMERVSIESAVAAAVETYGPAIHILVNNAGGGFPHSLFQPDDDAWNRTLHLNLTAHWIVTQTVWPHLVEAGGGAIVNVSSIAANYAMTPAQRKLVSDEGLASPPAYAAAKAGLEAITRHVASEGSKYGIRANAVRPGLILTPMVLRHGKPRLERFIEWASLTPGAGKPEDIANMIFFLASDESRFVNGQVLTADGGTIIKI
jgi:NAD(P)-dependent dehydrogenase (short-subunit alcohol dehydrogenase family)